MTLPRLIALRRAGDEPFHAGTRQLGFDLLDFWRWSVSDLVSNATRGRLAEYLVARALGGPATPVRDEWAAYDLSTADGIRIEVKSAAYLQAWSQRAPSTIGFSVRKARAWDPETNALAETAARHADVYVFALLAHMDKATLDPMNVEQWRFYVLPTSVLDARTRSQHSITLRSLEALCSAVSFAELDAAVRRVTSSGA